MPITRTPMVDDDGSGTTGTIINNAWKTELYNQIDGLAGSMGVWTPYTVTWTATTTNPAIGNGAIDGRYMVIGRTVFFRMRLRPGSTTTFGNGQYFFGLPPIAANVAAYLGAFPATLLQDGVRWWQGLGFLNNGATFGVASEANLLTQAWPWTWKNGDWLYVDGWYEMA